MRVSIKKASILTACSIEKTSGKYKWEHKLYYRKILNLMLYTEQKIFCTTDRLATCKKKPTTEQRESFRPMDQDYKHIKILYNTLVNATSSHT